MSEPISTKPYLLRALYEWCVDNGYTPYISVIVNGQTRVPQEYVRNGEIVLNIGPLAANKLKLGNEHVEFSARFGGVGKELYIPITQVSSIYARENGHGMSFDIDNQEQIGVAESTQPPPAAPDGSNTPPSSPGGKPSLRIVK
ncbi:MAG TPA: ClpXP protease specificity-enhancing factor [Burkholderiales bacterium]|nr:ClpXP protease specificity-enhancing factor [Burkholderiales bacterium]